MCLCFRLFKLLSSIVIGILLTTSASHAVVVINEVMAENANVVANLNDFPDWIELYNDDPVNATNVGHWFIREVEDTGPNRRTNLFRFPRLPSATIPPNGFLTVWCDDKTNSPGFHTLWGLPKTGTALTLLYTNGVPIVGSGVSFGIQVQDASIGRVPDGAGGVWQLNTPSFATNNTAYPQLGDATNSVKINEWAATNNLAGNNTTNDWIEIYNSSTNPVLITGMVIADTTNGRSGNFHAFTNLCFLGGEEFIRIWCDDELKPANHLPFNLSSTHGDTLRLFSANRTSIVDLITFLGNSNSPGYWVGNQSRGRLPDAGPIYPDLFLRPTPNDSNFQLMTNVLVNEVLSHTDPPFEDAIELYNNTDEPINIGGWWISNAKNTAKKFRIPLEETLFFSPIIQPRSYKVFFEMLGRSNEVPRPGFNTHGETLDTPLAKDFTLNSAHGDEVWIFSASNDFEGTLTGLRGSMAFDALENGVSAGPVANSTGEREVVPLRQRTFGEYDNPLNVQEFRRNQGEANSGPRWGPIVISEIYYHPPDIIRGTTMVTNIDNDLHEFVEVYNSATTNVPMYDPRHYGYADGRTNTWRLRGVVEENFPTNVVLGPGEMVLFVNFAMTNTIALNDFINRFNPPPGIRMYGPYSSKLDNSRGEITIRRPDIPQPPGRPDEGFVPSIQVDRVEYDDDPPWPTLADGATNRVDESGFGIHIGYSLQRIVVENYGDDPINWMAADPTPGRQAIKIENFARSGNSVTFRFRAWAGSGYTIQYSSTIDGTWVKLTDIAPQASSGTRIVTDPNAGAPGDRFYRIATPIQP